MFVTQTVVKIGNMLSFPMPIQKPFMVEGSILFRAINFIYGIQIFVNCEILAIMNIYTL